MAAQDAPGLQLRLQLQYQQPIADGAGQFHRLGRDENWLPSETALIICDMWDAHHCLNAVRRGQEIAPRIDALADELRQRGATIIHAPSGCMQHYAGSAARQRAQATPAAKDYPQDIASWCDRIPAEDALKYPIDQSDGGEDDDPIEHQQWADSLKASGRDPGTPWQKQMDLIAIDEVQDFISDSGIEIWNILESRKIKNVILVGVHTNMCVLGRPFGLRRMAAAGKNVVLCRDLTDTMYNPDAWPFVSHFTGTDRIVDYIERVVCPTIRSEQILGGQPFRFSKDTRPHLLMIIAEDEYQTKLTLPQFADQQLGRDYRVSFAFASDSDPNKIVGIEAIEEADAVLVSVRRRALPTADLDRIRRFVAAGKPVIGIRTASHAFALRNGESPAGHDVWPEFDAQVFGGNYTNHYGNALKSVLSLAAADEYPFPVDSTVDMQPAWSLYRVSPLAPAARPLLLGTVEGHSPEPVAWTFVRRDGGRSFYTSLGHIDDFAQPQFTELLRAGINWATDQGK